MQPPSQTTGQLATKGRRSQVEADSSTEASTTSQNKSSDDDLEQARAHTATFGSQSKDFAEKHVAHSPRYCTVSCGSDLCSNGFKPPPSLFTAALLDPLKPQPALLCRLVPPTRVDLLRDPPTVADALGGVTAHSRHIRPVLVRPTVSQEAVKH